MRIGIYQHIKGDLYQVLGVARHEETHEVLVVYQQLYGDYAVWVRNYDVFHEMIEYEGQHVPRFRFIRESVTQAPTLHLRTVCDDK